MKKVPVPAQVVSCAVVTAKRPPPTSTIPTTSNGKEEQTPCANSLPPPGIIRSEEIQAALMSKPQRGRKRGNLSELERLELTRTRNREHAKSTRERKKARYQELISNEEKLKHMEDRYNLYDGRRQCLIKLMTVRSAMINELAVVDDEDPNMIARDSYSESSAQESQNRGHEGAQCSSCTTHFTEDTSASHSCQCHRNMSFSSNTMSKVNVSSDKIERIALFVDKWCASTSGHVRWQDVVVDVNTISVAALPSFGTSLSPSTSSLEGKKGIAVLSECDRSTLAFIRSHFGLNRSITSVRYRIVGGEDGVAIAPNSVGFANVEVIVKEKNIDKDFVVTSALVQVEFEKHSSKIVSIGWCCPLAHNSSSSLSGQQGSSSELDRLARHISFPSVVSLEKDQCIKSKDDQQGTAGRNTSSMDHSCGDTNSANGLGMVI